ncbi:hypothetical protein WH43_00050 [Rheinheimera sp. KL1]|nr:hypothetical protein WH43_00050 [Rheinheimera sp. KL1]
MLSLPITRIIGNKGRRYMYSETRAAQMAAFMLQLHGGRMPYLKLIKLMYLAERKAMALWGESITGDSFVAMTRGPVLSQTYDLIKTGSRYPVEKGWEYYVKDEANHEVSLARAVDDDDFADLSLAETDILENIFSEFGAKDQWQLVDYTHDGNCPEWRDPDGSSLPIRPQDIFIALTNDVNKAAKLTDRYRENLQLKEQKRKIL